MSYHGLGQPAPTIPSGATIAPAASPDVATSPVDILAKRRGFVAVPTMDLRDYVQAQVVTMGIGFIVGVTVGAAIGNIVKGKASITANARRKEPKQEPIRCSYCSVVLRGDRRKWAERGYAKFCAKCEKLHVDDKRRY